MKHNRKTDSHEHHEHQGKEKTDDAPVPLVYGVVVDEHRLDLHRTEEARVARRAVVDAERDRRVF